MQQAANTLLKQTQFESFSKKNTQVNTFDCTISKALWVQNGNEISFHIDSNRFLRGMIRGLVGTMLMVGRGQIDLVEWQSIIDARDEQRVDFSTPAHGLYLSAIQYPQFFQKLR
jgi:tRNA pseudouridine38-40 synthase